MYTFLSVLLVALQCVIVVHVFPGHTPCVDPESFVRGGPNLITLLCVLVDGGRGSTYCFNWGR